MRDSWKEISLFDLALFRRGSFPQPYGLDKWYDDNNGMPFIQVYDVDDNMKLKRVTKRKISKLGSQMSVFIPKGSLILTIQGSIGRVAITDYDAYMDRTLLFFQKFYEEIDLKFIMYVIRELFNVAKENANGSTIKTITKEELSDYTINLPPLPQQKKIAKILSTVDAVIEQTESAIAKYQAIKQGLMHDLFTRGIDVNTGKLRPKPQDAPDLYKESALGLIPRDWEVKNLENFAVINYGKDYKSNPKGDDFPIYGTGGIMGWTSKVLNSGPAVLTGRKGTINRPIYVEGAFWNVDTIFCINSNCETNIKWFFYQMCSKDLTKLNEATGVPSVNSNALNNLKFSYPEKIEQDKIAGRINLIDQKIHTEQQALAKYQQLKAGLLQDLLTGKVAVSVD
ncbi:restriction endonuclease subunit S [uncultured Polaribacter sp.]|uniref:restriction endonuclease subunit S n=1 Tax=uncultured Polaribacter sp. TaxID=174711 RepID=UPI00259BC1E0|nr:restriction endonuclease subunit S [uncultured Polaribacter sp.]